MKYNKALDYLVVASREFRKGNHVNAARLFATANKMASMDDAIKILEANNRVAFKQAYPKLAARLEASNRVKASDDFEMEDDEPEIEDTDESVTELLQTLDEGGADVEADDEFGADDEEEDISDEDVDEVVAQMRASARRTRGKNTFAKVLKGMKG